MRRIKYNDVHANDWKSIKYLERKKEKTNLKFAERDQNDILNAYHV